MRAAPLSVCTFRYFRTCSAPEGNTGKSFAKSHRRKGLQQEILCSRVFARSPRQHLRGRSLLSAPWPGVSPKGRRASKRMQKQRSLWGLRMRLHERI